MSNFHLLLLVCFLSWTIASCDSSKKARYESLKEWNSWKSYHGKSYLSVKDEVEKHIVWLSNKEYVDQHNANAHIFGFNLDLNHLGDMVSECVL